MKGETGFWTRCLRENSTHHQPIHATTPIRQTSGTQSVSQEAYRAKRNLFLLPMKGVDVVDIEVDICIGNIDHTGLGTRGLLRCT
jgi:hypothetical protein